MLLPTLDDLVTLPEGEAIRRHFDARNYRAARWLVLPAAILATVGFARGLADGPALVAAAQAAILASLLALVLLRRRPFFAPNFRVLLLGAVALTVAALRLLVLGGETLAGFIPLLLVLVGLRLRPSEHLGVYGLVALAALAPVESWLGTEASAEGERAVPLAVVGGLCLGAALLLSRAERRRFLAGHRREAGRRRERLRLREEIDTARRIQLSMLPAGSPDVPWLDVAAASLPATEVGGDYYDYFVLSPRRLALAVGDVAGHGLASGLLLSGVRSCLYLLEEDLGDPVAVLRRLDAMVRRTTDKRTYMTLLLALLDRQEDGSVRLVVAAAGHPPLLLCSRSALEEVGASAPPLGTALRPAFAAVERRARPGETLVLYSDGLVEARGASGQEYGYGRLERAARRAGAATSARAARDEILGDLANLKGGADQADDITLVVARLR